MVSQTARQLTPPNRYRSGGPGRYRETAPRTERVNPHEAAGRARKLLKLTRALNRLASGLGLDDTAIAHWLSTRDTSQWALLARAAEVPMPSETTRVELVRQYDAAVADMMSARGAL